MHCEKNSYQATYGAQKASRHTYSGSALQGLMDDGGQVTLGAISGISAAAVASMPKGMLAGLMPREGESWDDLLLRLKKAVMQSVVENRVINELQL